MTLWLAGIVATSALGSVHCLAMCGPLAALSGAHGGRLAIVHALGRLTTYVAIGAGAGLVGGAIDLAGRLAEVQRAATLVSALVVVAWGVRAWRGGATAVTAGRETFARALVQIRTRPAARRAWLMGVLTGLLPCGWLWAFAITAGGTGSPVSGALVMAAFWLGTVPAMVGLLAFAAPVVAQVRARMPAVTAGVLIALGLGTLAMRWRDAGITQVTMPHCHSRGGAGS
jgi:sulfite exporter TauE/SafE